jgi:ribosomal-protein-alanine N-acetyltransferase
MTEALTAMLDFCFGDRFFFPTNRVEALIDLGNVASRGLLEKLGFVEEGIRREYGYWKDRFHDVRAFALLRRDWRR